MRVERVASSRRRWRAASPDALDVNSEPAQTTSWSELSVSRGTRREGKHMSPMARSCLVAVKAPKRVEAPIQDASRRVWAPPPPFLHFTARYLATSPCLQGNAVMDSQSSRHATLLNSDYGKSSKELIEFVGQLRALG